MIDYWSITQLTYVGNNSNFKAAKEEFSAIEKKSTENASRFQELKKIAEEKYNKGLDITEETEAVKAIAADEDALKKRVLEIMRSIYGKDWQPSPMDKSSFRL
jgi:thymidylate synthase